MAVRLPIISWQEGDRNWIKYWSSCDNQRKSRNKHEKSCDNLRMSCNKRVNSRDIRRTCATAPEIVQYAFFFISKNHAKKPSSSGMAFKLIMRYLFQPRSDHYTCLNLTCP